MLATVLLALLTPEPTRAAPLTCGAWSVVSSPNAGTSSNFLQAVAAVSVNDVWAVGFYFAMPGSTVPAQTLTEHWNGTSWSIVSSPNVGTNQNFLYGASAASSNDVWAVGEYSASLSAGVFAQTLTEHWNGMSWSIVSSPNVGSANNDLNGVTTLPANNQVWSVGLYDTNPTPQTLTEFHC